MLRVSRVQGRVENPQLSGIQIYLNSTQLPVTDAPTQRPTSVEEAGIRINCGGAAFTDSATGLSWLEDTYSSGGARYLATGSSSYPCSIDGKPTVAR
jgi:hypothetical protein